MKILLLLIFVITIVPVYSDQVHRDAIYVTDDATAQNARKLLNNLYKKAFRVVTGDADQSLYRGPTPIKQVQPHGSKKLFKASDADVWVHAVINADGKIVAAAIKERTAKGYDAAALEAIHNWQLKPATYKGEAVMGMILVPFNFVNPKK